MNSAAGSPPNVIDDVATFVRQHYRDFLNRESDADGLAFWSNQISSCGSSAQCNEVRRIDVSASFFLSIEFQQSGYLVERFYKVGYGDALGLSTFGSNHQLSVPVIRFAEFLRDTQRIGQGVIVLQPGWEAALENNKQAYALEFVQTARFTGQRPALSATQRERLLKLILRTLELDRVAAIQLDFDAVSSERDFYRSLLQDLRAKLSADVPLSMTALASFCLGDRWLDDLPVDEAVPMIFRMGADDRSIKLSLAGGSDFNEPLCRRSYGIALDEPLDMKFAKSRRLYVFNNHAWTQDDIQALEQRIRQ